MAVYEDMVSKDQLNRFLNNLKVQGLPLHNWTSGQAYKVGYTVVYDHKIFRCSTDHVASTIFNAEYWEQVSGTAGAGIPIQEWVPSTAYMVDDLIVYNYAFYQCITAHTSRETFELDETKWVRVTGDKIEIISNADIDAIFN